MPEGERPALGQRLTAVFKQPMERLTDGTVVGVDSAMALHLAAVRAAAARLAEAALMEAPVLGNWEAVVAYTSLHFASVKEHRTHVLFLDYRHRLMREPGEYLPDTGAADFAREVVSAALRRAASGLIVVRYDPDNPASPRPLDFEQADHLKTAGGVNAVSLHDFMLVSPMGHLNLRSMGLLEVAPDYVAVPLERPEPAADDGGGCLASPGESLEQLQRRAMADGADRLDEADLLALLLRRAVGDAARGGFAATLLAQFGSLGRVLSAPLEELADAVDLLPEDGRPDAPEVLAVHLGVIGEAAARLLRYCRAALGYDEVEQFRVLFLDRQHRLVWDEVPLSTTRQ